MYNLTKKLKQSPNLYSFSGVNDDEIYKAEKLLELKFSQEYKDYLREFGAISIDGHELTGICNVCRLDVVKITLEERTNKSFVTNDLYVIEQTHIDNIVIWQNEIGEIFQSSKNTNIIKIANSLFEFLNM